MQLNPIREPLGVDNRKWLGSRHGVANAQTVTIDGKKISAVVKDNVLPSGIPLKRGAGGKYEPVTAVGDALAGFLLTSQSAKQKDVDIVAPMLDRGRIRVKYLPEDIFDITTLTTPNPLFILTPKEGD